MPENYLMDQYSVLMVDDEEEILEIILRKLNWEELGFKIAGSAKNGVEALELAEELQPDVVMTDIKMPYMDGLTLAHRVKDINPKTKIIIFSGFDDFEYAKEAIKLEAEEYLLKPVNSEELEKVFRRIKTGLDRELDEERNVDKLKNYYMQSLPIMQESIYTALLQGQLKDRKKEELFENYQIEFNADYYIAALIHLSTKERPEGIEPSLLMISVRRLAEDELAPKWKGKFVNWFGDIVMIAELEDTKDVMGFTDDCDRFCRLVKKVTGAVVTVGIGNLTENPEGLADSFSGAESAVSYRLMYGAGKAINIAEIDPGENVSMPSVEDGMRDVFHRIKVSGEDELKESVKKLVDEIIGARTSIQQYKVFVMGMIAEIYRFGNSNSLNIEDIFGKDTDIYSEALSIGTPEQLVDWLYAISLKMQEKISSERVSSTKSFVDRAKEYVKENYSNKDLTIEMVCSYLAVSSAYFSTVFKKETGKTFGNYLTEVRMRKAVDMLVNDNEKTYVIAEKTGYSDPNYFSYVFKKQFGMSPSKYKAGVKAEQ